MRENWTPTHRHYKGGLYAILLDMNVKHTETLEELTIYEGEDGRIWARPTRMFFDRLPNGELRFTPLHSETQKAPPTE